MALLKAEAEKLSNNQLVAGVIEEIIDKDETFARLPFTGIDGKAYVYNRENTISEASFIDPVNDTVPEGAATFTEVTSKLRVLIGDVDVDKFLDTTMGDTNAQRATQIAAKAKGLRRKFQKTFANGDATGNPKEFDGIVNLVTAGQTIAAGANGAAITLTMLDELADAISNGADAFVMRSGTLRAYRALLRALGGVPADSVMMGNFGQPIPAHNGLPIIVNDFLPIDEVQGTETASTSIYAVRFNEADGLHGIMGGEAAGMHVEDLGTVADKDATRTRLKWYCGLALKSTKSLARIKGITNI